MATAVAVKAPAGVKLDRSRVNGELDSLSDARVGETLDFVYTRGSNPYSTRRVLVCRVNHGKGVEGIDQERDGEWRNFLDEYAENIDIVEPFAEENVESVNPSNEVRVRFDEASERLANSITGEKLAELYLQYVATEGESARYDADSGEVVVTLPAPQNSVYKVAGNSSVQFRNKRGDVLTQYLYDDGRIGVDAYENGRLSIDDDNISPEDFAVTLTRFLQG